MLQLLTSIVMLTTIAMSPTNIMLFLTIAISVFALAWSIVILRDILTGYSMASIFITLIAIVVFVLVSGITGYSIQSLVGTFTFIIVLVVSSILLLVDIFIMYKVYKIGKAIKIVKSRADKIKIKYKRLKSDINVFLKRLEPIEKLSNDLFSKTEQLISEFHKRKIYEW